MSQKKFFKSALAYEGKILSYYKRQQDIQNGLLNLIKSALPEHLAHHAQYCVVSQKKVLLYTDSANWSSQLRFYHQSMIQKISTSNQGRFEILQIKIIPPIIEQKEQPVPIPSKENITLLLEQANHQQDVTLKTALRNLAGTLERLSQTANQDQH